MDDDEVEDETALGIGRGDLLGDQYEVGALLGKGGMGAVHEARDRHLDRKVAIKVLPSFLGASKRAREGLRKEAARAIELSHPNLARIHHFGLHREEPYLVMEFVAGGTLAQLLDEEGALGVERTLEILRPLGEALDYAHGRKLVHRDIKPSNVLLREEDGAPVLIDFGIAGEVRDQATRTGHTATGTTTGTLSYMSPEQVKGDPPRPSMDVYALAAMAYEMLGGDPPFFRGDPLNVQYQIVHEPARPIEGLPETVNAALLRGLAKSAEDRPADARSFVEELGGAAPAEPAEDPTRSADTLLRPRPDEDPEPEDPKSAATLVVSRGPEEPTTWIENLQLRFLLGGLVGFGDGLTCTLLGGAIWNVYILNWAKTTKEFGGLLADPVYLFLLHFVPPFVAGAVVFGIATGFIARWLEERIRGVGPPFLFGVTSGGFVAGMLLTEIFMDEFHGREAVEAIGLILAAFSCMFVVAGIGLLLLPEKAGEEFDEEGLGTVTWWGWRACLAGIIPFFVASTGLVIGRSLRTPAYMLLFEPFAAQLDQHLLPRVALHMLPWALFVGPLLALITRTAAPYLEKKFRGTGAALVVGMTLGVGMNILLCWALGWYVGAAVNLAFFRYGSQIGTAIGAVTVLWTGRHILFGERVPSFVPALAVTCTRLLTDFLVCFLVLDLLGLASWRAVHLKAGLDPGLLPRFPGVFRASFTWALIPVALGHLLAVGFGMAHLFRDHPPGGEPRRGRRLVAATTLTTPILLWMLCLTKPEAQVAIYFWWPYCHAAALAALPAAWITLKGLTILDERRSA